LTVTVTVAVAVTSTALDGCMCHFVGSAN